MKEQSTKFTDQIYWSKTYQKSYEELTAQLRTQSGNLENTMAFLKAHKSALESWMQRLENNASISEEMRAIVQQHVQQACFSLDQSLEESQTHTQKLLLECNAKKAKTEKFVEEITTKASSVLDLQKAAEAEMKRLWSTTSDAIRKRLVSCQKQYQELKRGAEDAVRWDSLNLKTCYVSNTSPGIRHLKTSDLKSMNDWHLFKSSSNVSWNANESWRIWRKRHKQLSKAPFRKSKIQRPPSCRTRFLGV